MCGILGWIGEGPEAPPSTSWEAAMGRIAHRGPDSEGTWSSAIGTTPFAKFGHRRLSILDVSDAASQPMVSPLSGSVLVFNGQIYNFEELRGELKDFPYRGHGDTEVLCAALDRWGDAAVPRLRGMFAFSWWHPGSGRLLLARDRLGEKPLYWSHGRTSKVLVFASETRSLLSLLSSRPAVSRNGLGSFMAWGSVSDPHTMWEGVESLQAGTIGVFQHGRFTQKSYWCVDDYTSNDGGSSESLSKSLVGEAVRSQLASDVPVGVFLSSGIDSAVVALEARRSSSSISALTLAFAEDPSDESKAAAFTAKRLSIEHAVVTYKHNEVPGLFRYFCEAQDQPSIDGLNTWLISRAARSRGFKVMLSGVGADELFMGYSSFRRLSSGILASHPFLAQVGRSIKGIKNPQFERLLGIWAGKTRGDSFPLFRIIWAPSNLSQFGLSMQSSRNRWHHDDDDLAALSRHELTHYLKNTLLRDADAMSMSNSLELRAPFLDYRLIQSVLQLPTQLKVAGGVSKALLKSWYADLLGSEILQRPKVGFGLPLARWIDNELASVFAESLRTVGSSGLLGDSFLRFCSESRMSVSQKLQVVVLGQWLSLNRQ
jgi:asparagine synthase (glutamine-hydrolysing)